MHDSLKYSRCLLFFFFKMASIQTDNPAHIWYRRNTQIQRLTLCSDTITEEMDEEFYTPDSTITYDVDFLLEEALVEYSEHPANFISTHMPSRQLYRSGLRTSWPYQTCQLARKRTSSSSYRNANSINSTDCVIEDSPKPMSPCLMDSVDLLKGAVVNTNCDEDNAATGDIFYKHLAVPICRKRELRDSYSKSREHIASRNRRPNWKAKMSKNYYSFRESVGSAYSNVRFWANSIHNIEGHYGTAVAAVFFFMQWLMSINLWIMIAVISFIVIPNSVIINNSSVNKTSITNRPVASLTCNSNETDEQEDAEFGDFQDLLQGTGWMEWTPMFYGYYFYNYTNNTYYEDGNAITYGCTKDLTYNLPLAYIIVTVVYFSMCLILILRSTAKDSREILFTATAKINEGCNLVFGGWDFCIVEEKEAIVRREIIYNEITNIFEEEKLSEERLHRTKRQNVKIIFIRILINTFVFIILACCGLLIYAVIIGSQQALSVYSGSGMIVLLIEFLPPFTITTLNLIVPIIFEKLVIYECYSPVSVINMTLGRTVVLKLAGILVLLASLYKSIVKNKFCTHHCWETYVGQQIYKLTIMDFVSIIFITFFIQFPRKLIVERVQWPFIQWIGQQPFDIPSQVLDIVYSQTLCWLGTFFSPLLSVVNVIKFFILFYVKRFSLFVNCAPARLTYRASKSNKLFMMILLLSYLIAILPVFFSIVEITPSNDCGPFIGYNTMWDIIPETMENWPASLRKLINYFTTAGFIVPAIASLSLIIYFYATIASAHSHEKELMQDQLLVEGQDKQYLLKKLHQVMEELSNTASIGAVHSFQARQRID